ncbi:MAG TPA: rRNA maturation RNase YbeY [Solirubrobacteraceae bacterium]|nr:rRNA maturation RNase YbeY [Solirubrobacteraceae bacterium]
MRALPGSTMIEVEVFDATAGPGRLAGADVRRLCTRAASSRGVSDGHVAVELVNSARIAQLNNEHRGKAAPTDVLSFPIDGAPPPREARVTGAPGGPPQRPHAGAPPQRPHAAGVPVELGDIVICPEHTADLREAVVHGMLHLLGMDHETDSGEMLALQAEILAGER